MRYQKEKNFSFPTSNILVSIIRHSLIPCSLSWYALSRQATFSFVQFFLAQIGHESWGTSVYDDGTRVAFNQTKHQKSSHHERKRIKNWKKPMQTSLVQANLAVYLSINHHIYHSCTCPSGVGSSQLVNHWTWTNSRDPTLLCIQFMDRPTCTRLFGSCGKTGRGIYFWKFNPLLFTALTLSLPQTRIKPKHSERAVWPQIKGHFWTQHPWKPLDETPCLALSRNFNDVDSLFSMLSYLLDWWTTQDLSWVVCWQYMPLIKQACMLTPVAHAWKNHNTNKWSML